MKAVGIVGPSGAGKTNLIEALIPLLDGRIATVKSIHHPVEIDDPGTDTHRHRTAGAERVVGITPALTFAIEPDGKADHATDWSALHRVLQELAVDGYDTVLVEGFTASPLPKVVVGGEPVDLEGEVLETVATEGAAVLCRLARAIEDLDPWTP